MGNDLRTNSNTTSCLLTALKWTSIVLLITALLIFILIFVVFPLVFMNTLSLQRFLVFTNIDQPKNPEYNNYEKYDAHGVRNFYVNVDDLEDPEEKVSLGVWQVVPEDRIEASENDPQFDFKKELRESKSPVIIYFHGQGGTRIFSLPLYNVIRKYFHVIAVDYRSYADSTAAELSELAVVSDCKQFYEWVLRNTDDNVPIYVWGHSLGTALSTHTVKKITEDNTITRKPMGLILESPFTTMREEVYHHPIAKIFKWLAYFEATIVNPLRDNGFLFETTTNILKVDSPIMIVHSEDDRMIPYTLGKTLAEVANTERDLTKQGKCIYHMVPATFRCDHLEIHRWPALSENIEIFIDECINFQNAIGR